LIRAIKKDMVFRQCPATGGNPTRMTAESWEKLCRHHRERVAKGTSALNNEVSLTKYCEVCRGKRKPKELEIVEHESAKNRN
ncbi:MAG: hypothetical protein RBS96_09275, partial [Dehalococcoidales bacterium]|nr:hypothetical protein [Dehalococcoidales bacterium]